jgi:hypothetical protein
LFSVAVAQLFDFPAGEVAGATRVVAGSAGLGEWQTACRGDANPHANVRFVGRGASFCTEIASLSLPALHP